MPSERWRIVTRFPWYEVSDFGRVRSLGKNGRRYPKPLMLKLAPAPNGYPYVSMSHEGSKQRHMKVSRLVLEAFIGPARGRVARHVRNNNPMDNRLLNLKWGTQKQNSADRITHGTYPYGTRVPSARLTDAIVAAILRSTEPQTNVG